MNFKAFIKDKSVTSSSIHQDHHSRFNAGLETLSPKNYLDVKDNGSKLEVEFLKSKQSMNQSVDDCSQENKSAILIVNTSTDEKFQRSTSNTKSQILFHQPKINSTNSSLQRQQFQGSNQHRSSNINLNLPHTDSIERRLTNLTSLKQEGKNKQNIYSSYHNKIDKTRNQKGAQNKTEAKSESRKFVAIINSGKKNPNITKREQHQVDQSSQQFIIKSKHIIKLSPKIEPKFNGRIQAPSHDSKCTSSYKERGLSDNQKNKAQKPKVIHVDLNMASQKYALRTENRQFQEVKNEGDQDDQSFEIDSRPNKFQEQRPSNFEEDKSPSISVEKHQVNCGPGGNLYVVPRYKMFKSFIDSYVSERKKTGCETHETKYLNTSLDNSISTDMNNSIIMNINNNTHQANNQCPLPVKSQLSIFEHRKRSAQNMKQEDNKTHSKTKILKYEIDVSQHSGEIASPNVMIQKSRNDDEFVRPNQVQQPLSSNIKTKFQYFNENSTSTSPTGELQRKHKSPLLIQIPNGGDIEAANTLMSPSPSTAQTLSKTAQHKDISKLNTVHQTNYSPSMFMRSQNISSQFLFPQGDQSPKIQFIDSEDMRETLKIQAQIPQHLNQSNLQQYFNDDQTPAKSARLQISDKKNNIRSNKHKQNNSMYAEEVQGFQDIRSSSQVPINYCSPGCSCAIFINDIICQNAQKWIELTYQDEYQQLMYQKVYEGFYYSSPRQRTLITQIQKDVERTFQQHHYFNRKDIQDSLSRVLTAYAHYEPMVGYVQGMSFIAGALLYHAGEVATFWLMIALMDQYSLKDIFKQNLPGLIKHETAIEKLGKTYLEDIFSHFDKYDIKINYFTTDWIMSIFMNYIPLDINHIFLNKFFEEKWAIFYRVAISVLKYFQHKILKKHDFHAIIGEIKQAREGCEHLKAQLSMSQSSLSSFASSECSRESIYKQKYVDMWDEIIDLATTQWETLNSEFIRKHDKKTNSHHSKIVQSSNNKPSMIVLHKAR